MKALIYSKVTDKQKFAEHEPRRNVILLSYRTTFLNNSE